VGYVAKCIFFYVLPIISIVIYFIFTFSIESCTLAFKLYQSLYILRQK
jgi:hypothetical protein